MAKKGKKSTPQEAAAGKKNLQNWKAQNPDLAKIAPFKHGLYTEIDLNCLDKRTRLAKAIKSLKKELRDFVGNPTPATELLIHRIIYKTVKLSLYESTSLQDPKNEEAAHYLPMSNSLRLDLVALAGMVGKSKPPDLGKYLAENYGDKG